MNIRQFIIAFILFIIPLTTTHGKSIDDWQARTTLSIKKELNQKLDLSISYYQYFDNNISHFDKSVLGSKISYKLTEQLTAATNYRHTIASDKYMHEMRHSLKYKPNLNLNKWQLSYQVLYQHKFTKGYKPDNYLRNMIQVDYKIAPIVTLFTYSENFLQINRKASHVKQRYAFGSDMKINKQHSTSLYLIFQDNHHAPWTTRLEATYTYKF